MSFKQQYEETHGIQAAWIETHEARPYNIKPKYFIDVDGVTVAKADNQPDILDLLDHYPSGVLRFWNPTQEEYALELETSKKLHLNNFGIMSNEN